MQVRETALGQGPYEVERGRGGVVHPPHPARVGPPGRRVELRPVDRVAPVDGQGDAVTGLGRRRARLGVLPGHPADLDHRHGRRVREHHGHLEQGAQRRADRFGGGLPEGLRAVPALEQERLAAGHRRQPVPQPVALLGEHQRRGGAQFGDHRVPGRLIGPLRLLPRRRRDRRCGTALRCGYVHHGPQNGIECGGIRRLVTPDTTGRRKPGQERREWPVPAPANWSGTPCGAAVFLTVPLHPAPGEILRKRGIICPA